MRIILSIQSMDPIVVSRADAWIFVYTDEGVFYCPPSWHPKATCLSRFMLELALLAPDNISQQL